MEEISESQKLRNRKKFFLLPQPAHKGYFRKQNYTLKQFFGFQTTFSWFYVKCGNLDYIDSPPQKFYKHGPPQVPQKRFLELVPAPLLLHEPSRVLWRMHQQDELKNVALAFIDFGCQREKHPFDVQNGRVHTN